MERDQIILIHGGAYTDVKKALVQWIVLYKEAVGPDFQFQLYKLDRGQHLIQVDARVDNEHFFYLVNYLYYPEGIHYKVVVEGYTTWRDMDVLVFMPEEERQPDNVYLVTTEKQVFKIDFGGKVNEVVMTKEYSRPDIDLASLPPPERIRQQSAIAHNQPAATAQKRLFSTGDHPERRFKTIILIVIALFILSYLEVGHRDRFQMINSGIALAVAGWLFYDYKLLQQRKYYAFSVALATAILFYGYYLVLHFSPPGESKSFAQATLIPFLFLALQYPSRYTFKVLMKREPVVDRPAPSVADFFYMAVLWMGVIGVFMLMLK